MKKLISTIAIVLFFVSCLFSETMATELHNIRLVTVVDGRNPAFQFEFTSGMADGEVSVRTNYGSDIFNVENEYNEHGTRATAVGVADISRYQLDLLFTAKLANNAKCARSYTLTFTANGFDVTRAGVAGKHAPSSKVVAAASDVSERKGVLLENLVASESVEVRFTGIECEAGALATFRVQFQADSSIDPSTYYSDIVMEIASNS